MPTLWIKNHSDAKDLPRLMALAMGQNLPQQVQSEIMNGKFMVVPNTLDSRGGYLVVFSEDKPSGLNRATKWAVLIMLAVLLLWLVLGS